jgi:hypothetical protein
VSRSKFLPPDRPCIGRGQGHHEQASKDSWTDAA